MTDEKFKAMARDWWFENHLSAASGEVKETHEDSLAALLSQVDAEATERAAKVCDREAAEYHRMARPSSFDLTLTVPSSSLNGERALMYQRAAQAIRSTLPTPAAQAGEENQ